MCITQKYHPLEVGLQNKFVYIDEVCTIRSEDATEWFWNCYFILIFFWLGGFHINRQELWILTTSEPQGRRWVFSSSSGEGQVLGLYHKTVAFFKQGKDLSFTSLHSLFTWDAFFFAYLLLLKFPFQHIIPSTSFSCLLDKTKKYSENLITDLIFSRHSSEFNSRLSII